MSFDVAFLVKQLQRFPSPHRYCVAYSGGCDSHTLLHALAQARDQLRDQLACSSLHAIHVNHGLHVDADKWTEHCAQICATLEVPCEIIKVGLELQNGDSVEAVARDARYNAFKNIIKKDDIFLLAHHQDDQAETLMLQLLRGAGVNGLAAMPAIVEFGGGWLVRPLLDVTREQIMSYATKHQLQWTEDPSNRETNFDRNYLRHRVMPRIKDRWPSASATLLRASQHQAEAATLLDELAQTDFENISPAENNTLSVTDLLLLSPARRKNVLRYWIKHVCKLPLPNATQLNRILTEVLPVAGDREPVVQWAGAEVRRYRDVLYLAAALREHDTGWQARWDMKSTLILPSGGQLTTHELRGSGIRKDAIKGDISVRFRQGGERCRLSGRKHHHELKKLFQDWGVPPWQRDRIPLIYLNDQLAQIVGYGLCEPFVAGPGEYGIDFRLQD